MCLTRKRVSLISRMAFALFIAMMYQHNLANPATTQTPPENAQSSAIKQSAPNFSAFYDLVYQIRVIETETNNKAALGSGFQISEDGLIITNYHVISNQVFKHDHHRIEFTSHEGGTGELRLLAFDVVNDLALLKREDAPTIYFPLASAEPEKGESIFALGNPHDVGMLMVDGAYNGLADNSYADRILFSGSLNPGMSGGPTLNASGEIVGVNVATAGSQLSFLVPVSKVKQLLEQTETPLSTEQYQSTISKQIQTFQQGYFSALLDSDWKLEALGDRLSVAGELGLDTSCWGRSNDDNKDSLYRTLTLTCQNSNHIYLEPYFNTGVLHYSYFYRQSDELNSHRFHTLVGSDKFWPDNQATDEQVTPYKCEQNFIEPSNSEPKHHVVQIGICSRAYLDLDGLYDVAFYRTSSSNDESLMSHFTLAGVSEDIIRRFTQKFMDEVQWKQ